MTSGYGGMAGLAILGYCYQNVAGKVKRKKPIGPLIVMTGYLRTGRMNN